MVFISLGFRNPALEKVSLFIVEEFARTSVAGIEHRSWGENVRGSFGSTIISIGNPLRGEPDMLPGDDPLPTLGESRNPLGTNDKERIA